MSTDDIANILGFNQEGMSAAKIKEYMQLEVGERQIQRIIKKYKPVTEMTAATTEGSSFWKSLVYRELGSSRDAYLCSFCDTRVSYMCDLDGATWESTNLSELWPKCFDCMLQDGEI
jgi:hypothetical protein